MYAVFPTATKDSSTISIEELAAICAAVTIPVVAIGGLTAANAATTLAAGCAGIAVVSAIFDTQHPAEAAAEVRRVVDSAFPP